MEKKNVLKKQVVITVLGFLVLIVIAIFCYNSVKETIVKSEQESLKSMATVNAQSLAASLQGKRDLIYAALSGDMDDVGDVEKGLLKLHEKGKYVSQEEFFRGRLL